jgi:hypothetical protein
LLKKKITYTDFNDQQVTEEFCFHLSKAELIQMEVEYDGGLQKYLTGIAESDDNKKIFEAFQELLMKSYGQRSEDGKRFIKSQELRDEFASSEAYSEFIMSLATDAGAAAEFVNGILPGNLEADVDRIVANNVETAEVPQDTDQPAPITQAHADTLTRDSLVAFLQSGGQIID